MTLRQGWQTVFQKSWIGWLIFNCAILFVVIAVAFASSGHSSLFVGCLTVAFLLAVVGALWVLSSDRRPGRQHTLPD